MVYLISGKKNEGKTAKLKDIAAKLTNPRGFIAEKVQDCGRVTTYTLTDLRTGEQCTMARLASLPLPEDWGEDFHHGPFRFSLKAFEWSRRLLDEALEEKAACFVIDEVGKIELEGGGHADVVRRALTSDMDLYISVRDINLNAVVEAFSIGEHQVITI